MSDDRTDTTDMPREERVQYCPKCQSRQLHINGVCTWSKSRRCHTDGRNAGQCSATKSLPQVTQLRADIEQLREWAFANGITKAESGIALAAADRLEDSMSALSFDEIDATLERHTKMVAETWAWELYLVVLDMLEGSVVKSFQAEAAARVLVAKIAALEVRR